MAYSDDNIVSEKFLLNLAGESIQSSFERRVNAVTKLKTIIEWAFTLFTTSGFIIGVFKDVNKFPNTTIWLFGVAFALLTIAYALAGVAQYPVSQNFHPNDTEEIARSFSSAVKKQSSFFQLASIITMLAFLSLAIGILLLFTGVRKESTPPGQIINVLNANTIIEKRGDTAYNIALTVVTDSNKPISISVKGNNEKDTVIKYTELAGFPFITDSAGRAYVSIAVPKGFDIYWLQIGVTINNADTVIEKIKTIKLNKPS